MAREASRIWQTHDVEDEILCVMEPGRRLSGPFQITAGCKLMRSRNLYCAWSLLSIRSVRDAHSYLLRMQVSILGVVLFSSAHSALAGSDASDSRLFEVIIMCQSSFAFCRCHADPWRAPGCGGSPSKALQQTPILTSSVCDASGEVVCQERAGGANRTASPAVNFRLLPNCKAMFHQESSRGVLALCCMVAISAVCCKAIVRLLLVARYRYYPLELPALENGWVSLQG